MELARARLTGMLASHHEAMAESAPSEKPCQSYFCHLANNAETFETASPSKPSASSATEASASTEKSDPVTKRDHLDAAADLMSDIQVETYSSMDKREKTEL